MNFGEKLQNLRKQRGLTQEELAEALYVSRTAVSKWESGRGLPNIDSLRHLASLFSVTVDDLLSGEQLLSLAEADTQKKEGLLRDLVFGLLDVGSALLLFLPFFGQRVGDGVLEVSLLALSGVSGYLRILYFVLVGAMVLWGLFLLALQSWRCPAWLSAKHLGSLGLMAAATLLFVLSLQPYAAVFLFVFLMIKVLLLVLRK